jgi:hypothetical protein
MEATRPFADQAATGAGFGAAGRRRTRPSQARHGAWTGLTGRPGPAGRGRRQTPSEPLIGLEAVGHARREQAVV